MKRILLAYPPFCTPATPPYSVTGIYSFLKANLNKEYSVNALDLNMLFHKKLFHEYQKYYKNFTKNFDREEYEKITKEFLEKTKKTYYESNIAVVKGQNPELFDDIISEILKQKPDVVAFSVVYSSQAFYTQALVLKLKKLGVKTVIGGPAVNEKLAAHADASLKNEIELLEFITKKRHEHESLSFDYVQDFGIYDLKDYFTAYPVIPIKTSSTCYYRQCAFCSHHEKKKYYEFSLDKIKEFIVSSKQKHFFVIDDMIHKKRILEIAEILKPLKVSWTCQLKPTKEFDSETFRKLSDAGLKGITWGVESGCDRILDLMKKGTNKKDIEKVLLDSKNAGIKNVVYIMLGFPTETKEEFLETIDFLKQNEKNIDLISTSVFGLQKGTPIYDNPAEFGVTKIIEEKRTVLEPRITYEVKSGLSQQEASSFRRKYKKTLEKISKYPKGMNFFREHIMMV